jgi:hypothetical protein
VLRLSTSNAVTAVAPEGFTIGGASTFTLSTLQRLYLFYFDGTADGFVAVS